VAHCFCWRGDKRKGEGINAKNNKC
jgi:hypothetical protein